MSVPLPFILPAEAIAGFKDADKYDTHRPSYPAEAVSKFLAHLNILDNFNAKIVEVGAGTGKLTELLAVQKQEYEIIAVDPHDEMREALVRKVLPRVKVEAGDAANMPIEEGWGDVCIAAQVSSGPTSQANGSITQSNPNERFLSLGLALVRSSRRNC
jgi:SAM-dependent methyltransferase